MPVVLVLLVLCCGFEAWAVDPFAPLYSAASIVNGADNQSGELAPNTIATVYGKNLSFSTWAATTTDGMPPIRSATGVNVLIGNRPANLYYVSPTQVNLLVPPCLLPGATSLQLGIDTNYGPLVPIQLAAAAPALFQLDLQYAVATRADWSVLTPAHPARPGDVVILYATGLGQTTPLLACDELPTSATPLRNMADFQVLLDGVAVDARAVLYAGVAPGFAGLYQINLVLPAATGANPEVRIGLVPKLSIHGVKLPVSPR
jgi:uncharacterized protein (TIGR03437 family)